VLLDLVELSLPDGSAYIVEPDGTPLQYIRAPFVVPVYHQESRRYPVNRWLAARARRRFERLRLSSDWMHTGVDGCHIRRIPCVHPEVRRLAREDPSFTFRQRSVFDRTPGACDVLRTMNIFNKAYFSAVQLTEGAAVAFESLRPGGMWIVGRTLEADFTNHVTFFRRKDNGWEVLERIGQGSEIEDLALSAGAPAGRGRFA
jgi:hypothetical protein